MRSTVLLALIAVALAPAPRAQGAPARPLVVMNLAAHPDDEDGATLAYYRGHEDAVAYSVLFTRGEGGQNEIGPELYEHLGVIRTAETEAAARILGIQVHYLNFFDFGFSKWASETFAEWSRPRRGFWDVRSPIAGEDSGRDEATARLVYLIRRLRPDVIFTNHDTVTVAPRAQHGHHQAVGLTAWEAFERAADPAYHPEQLREPGVELWQPRRLFVRSRGDDRRDVAVPVSAPCGAEESCSDRAVRAAMLHRSQGFDLLAPRFFRRDTTYFTLYRQAAGVPHLPIGAADLAAGLSPNPNARTLSTAYLVASGRRELGDFRVTAASGTGGGSGSVYVGNDLLTVPGREFELTVCRVSTPCSGQMGRQRIRLGGAVDTTLEARGRPPVARFRLPDGLAPDLPAHRTQYDRTSSGRQFVYEVRGGAAELPVVLLPPLTVNLAPAPVRLVGGENTIPVSVRTYDPAAETVSVRLTIESTDLHSTSDRPPLHTDSLRIAPADTAAVFRFILPADAPVGEYRVTIEATASPTSAPAEPYVETRPAGILPDVRVADGLRVGFVRSYDQTTENALRAMGADVVLLDSAALAEGRFDGLHTIVLDIRAYLARPDLRRHNQNVLDWVRAGGHLVVGYQKTFEWNAGAPDPTQPEESGVVNPDFAPYPLELGRDRVVREDAPVDVLAKDHSLFTSPHAIGADDWSGWVQERGLYFPETYDERYRELLSMNDPGEPALRGGLLLAEVGEGTYLYSPLVWYRQLEALNPGAWRLFANLVSLPLAGDG